ncbi:MAG TPA: hypothetical protein ENK28_08385 [Aliiroseovarius sp.]|nr:hypothetical protein [Aliiroseovarius sp.]
MRIALLGALLGFGLSACTLTPLQQCQSPFKRALADNQAQIVQSELNIQRGHIFVPSTSSFGVRYCLNDRGDYRLCLGIKDGQQTFKKVRIDVAAEQAKLQVLQSRRGELQASLAQCSARFPAG